MKDEAIFVSLSFKLQPIVKSWNTLGKRKAVGSVDTWIFFCRNSQKNVIIFMVHIYIYSDFDFFLRVDSLLG